jgi:hypothetical protein
MLACRQVRRRSWIEDRQRSADAGWDRAGLRDTLFAAAPQGHDQIRRLQHVQVLRYNYISAEVLRSA